MRLLGSRLHFGEAGREALDGLVEVLRLHSAVSVRGRRNKLEHWSGLIGNDLNTRT